MADVTQFDLDESKELSPEAIVVIEDLGNAINNFPCGKPLGEAVADIQNLLVRLRDEYQITLKPISLNSIEFK